MIVLETFLMNVENVEAQEFQKVNVIVLEMFSMIVEYVEVIIHLVQVVHSQLPVTMIQMLLLTMLLVFSTALVALIHLHVTTMRAQFKMTHHVYTLQMDTTVVASCIIDTDSDGVCDENEILGCIESGACNFND